MYRGCNERTRCNSCIGGEKSRGKDGEYFKQWLRAREKGILASFGRAVCDSSLARPSSGPPS